LEEDSHSYGAPVFAAYGPKRASRQWKPALLVDQEMSCGDEAELSGMGV